jgi:stearoyl-CoA desaturase (delta-9 desaturase)
VLIWLTQMAWIPFLAAGVINGVGHFWGYRSWSTPDASTNIVPWGIVIGGEELHNNHHAYPTSARFSNKWYELDVGWWYVRALSALGLATARYLPPTARLASPRAAAGVDTVEAIIRCRYEVLASYDRMPRPPHAVHTLQAMRAELAALWSRSMASREHLVAQLEDWCRRAEASGIASLAEFSQRLRRYA